MLRIRSLLRLTAPALAAFAWRNRDELFEWANFGLRAVQSALPGGSDLEDVKTEGRLRYALGMDRRTRRADGLHVEVFDGIALLHGVVSPDVFDVAPHIAAGVTGVRMVDNRLTETRRGLAAVEIGRHQPRALDARTAVDDEHLARQPRRRVGEQEERSRRDVVGNADAAGAGAPCAMPSSFGSQSARAMSVLTRPGATALTRTPGASSCASCRVRWMRAAFDTLYAPMNGPGTHAADGHDVED